MSGTLIQAEGVICSRPDLCQHLLVAAEGIIILQWWSLFRVHKPPSAYGVIVNCW